MIDKKKQKMIEINYNLIAEIFFLFHFLNKNFEEAEKKRSASFLCFLMGKMEGKA